MPGILPVSPLVDPSNYDKITIAGIDTGSLGFIVEVTGAERPYNWDVKRAAGSQGDTITYRGWSLAKPKLKFKFWTDAGIQAFYDQVTPVIAYDADKQAPKPFDIYHPKLFANLIFWLVTEKIGDLVDEGAQLWSVTVETLEYRQAKSKNATSTPEQSNSNQNGSATKPTVLDDQDREILALKKLWDQPT